MPSIGPFVFVVNLNGRQNSLYNQSAKPNNDTVNG